MTAFKASIVFGTSSNFDEISASDLLALSPTTGDTYTLTRPRNLPDEANSETLALTPDTSLLIEQVDVRGYTYAAIESINNANVNSPVTLITGDPATLVSYNPFTQIMSLGYYVDNIWTLYGIPIGNTEHQKLVDLVPVDLKIVRGFEGNRTTPRLSVSIDNIVAVYSGSFESGVHTIHPMQSILGSTKENVEVYTYAGNALELSYTSIIEITETVCDVVWSGFSWTGARIVQDETTDILYVSGIDNGVTFWEEL